MQFSNVLVFLTSAVFVSAAPGLSQKRQADNNGDGGFEIQACGSSICSGAVSSGEAECTLSCHWGPCERFTCSDDSTMVCGTNRDSCTTE